MTRLLAALFLLANHFAPVAADGDPIKAEIDKARAVYTEKIEAAKTKLLAAIDAALKEAASKGDLRGVKDFKTQRDLFEKEGKLPGAAALNRAKSAYQAEIRDAETALRKALQRAQTDYTKALKIEEAEAVEKELEHLAKPSKPVVKPTSDSLVVGSTWTGSWIRIAPNRGSGDVRLKITERKGTDFKGDLETDNGAGFWHVEGSVKGNEIALRYVKRVRGREDVVGNAVVDGVIRGDSLEMRFSIRGIGDVGTYSLRREKK
jgi:hypothetical protein